MNRAVVALPLIALATAGFGLPATVAGLVGAHRSADLLTRRWARTLLALLGVRVAVDGAAHCPAGPAVYAANHASALDIPILFAALPVDFRIIHKRSLYLVPVIGFYLFAAGHVGIDRGNAFRARRSLARAVERIRAGTSVAVFPQGTRSGALRPFKRGSFTLAIAAGVPVVPVSLVGVKGAAPRGIRGFRGGSVRLRIHPPVATEGRTLADAPALAAEVEAVVARGCEAA